MTASTRCLRLNTGALMPAVGLGTYMIQGEKGKEIVDKAIFLGYRLFDTALSYGNESDIGDVILRREREGFIKRKDLFLTSKVPSVYMNPPDVIKSVEQSMENLKTKYIDLMLIHHPWGLKNRGNGNFKPTDGEGRLEFCHYDLVLAWNSMETLLSSDKARAIGVSNFTINQIERIIKQCKIPPANIQLECHAYLQQRSIYQYSLERGITLTAYSPLGAPARPQHHIRSTDPVLLDEPVIEELSRKYKRTKGNILLKWLIQRGISVVPKASSECRLKENLNIYDFDLVDNDMKKIAQLDRRVKYFQFENCKGHPEYFQNEDF